MTLDKVYLYLTLSLISSIGLFAQAQDWQWAKRGGGVLTFQLATPSGDVSSRNSERVLDLAIDSNDNYYFLAELEPSAADYDGVSLQTFSASARKDILVISTDCSGTLRWTKTFGGSFDDRASSIGVDSFNNVYVSGLTINMDTPPHPHFANDTIKTAPSPIGTLDASKKNAFVIKYDDQGVFQWFREPQGDVAAPSNALVQKTVVEPNGRTHTLMAVGEGTHFEGQLTLPPGSIQSAIVIYDANGVLEDFFLLDMQPGNGSYFYQLAYDPNLQRYYIADTMRSSSDNLSINGFGINSTQGLYLAALDNQGQVLWYHESSKINDWSLGDIKIDTNGDIYFTGYFNSNSPAIDTFAGFSFIPDPNINGKESPFLVKLDSSGNLIWGTNATLFSRFPGRSIAVKGNDLYLGLGSLFNEWDAMPFGNEVAGQGLFATDNAVLRFNKTTGSLEEVIAMPGTGFDMIMALGIDSNDNIVVGGHFGSSLLDNHPAGTLFKAGGNTDFFIAQYGSGNCSTLSIHEPAAPVNIKLYPQPAKDIVHLQSDVPLSSYAIYSLQGQRIQAGAVQDNRLDTAQLAPGVYILQITDNEERKHSFKLVVE